MISLAIVDQNQDSAAFLEKLLRARYKISTYQNSADAISCFKKVPPDIILIDSTLTFPLFNIPTIALTPHSKKVDEQKLFRQGFDGYLSKPILDFDIVFQVIETLIHKVYA